MCFKALTTFQSVLESTDVWLCFWSRFWIVKEHQVVMHTRLMKRRIQTIGRGVTTVTLENLVQIGTQLENKIGRVCMTIVRVRQFVQHV